MALSVVEAVPAGSKQLAAMSVRSPTGEIHDVGASLLLLTRASSLHIGRAGGLAVLQKLAELIGPSTAQAEDISPCFSSSAAALSVRSRVFLSVSISASMAKRGC